MSESFANFAVEEITRFSGYGKANFKTLELRVELTDILVLNDGIHAFEQRTKKVMVTIIG
jgi:hypothetical protein